MTSGTPVSLTSASAETRVRPCGRDNAGAPVAEAVTIGCHRDRRVEHQVVTADQIGHAGEVDVEVEYYRGGLRAVVDHFEADVNLHYFSPCVLWRRAAIMARSGRTCRA